MKTIYKLTAIGNTKAFVAMHKLQPEQESGRRDMVPGYEEKWVTIPAGQTLDNIAQFYGVAPWCVRDEKLKSQLQNINGKEVLAPEYNNADLPKVFFGLFSLEFRTEG